MKRITWIAIILAVLLAAAIVILFPYSSLPQDSRLRISLLYDNASKGLYPDGTRFSPYEVLSDEVIQPVADEFDLTLEQMKSHLGVSYAGSETRITTDFFVSCKGYQKEYAEQVLQKVGESYEAYLENKYLHSNQVSEIFAKESGDLLDLLDMMTYKAEALAGYVNEVYEETGEYAELRQQLNDLVKIQIKSLRDIVVETGTAKNEETVRRILEYQNLVLGKKEAEAEEQEQVRLEAIEIYDATLFPTISVPSVDKGQYYISTTHTGLDDVYTDAKYFMDTSLDLQNTITANEYTLSHLGGVTEEQDAAKNAKTAKDAEPKELTVDVTAMIAGVEVQLKQLEEQVDDAIVLRNEKLIPFVSYGIVREDKK